MSAKLPKTAVVTLPLLAGLALLVSSSLGPSVSRPVAGDKYIGAAKCKNCHSSEETGDPYGAWTEAKHSKAYETLTGAAAKEIAAKRDIADPAKADACLKCHVTGFGEPKDMFARGFKEELGVQCESCHGPGEAHMKARFKAAASGATAEGYQGVAVDEMVTSPGVEVCVKCHNPESPNYKPFCYYEARAKIAHLNPQKKRTAEELADYGKCPCGSPCPHADGCPDGKCNLKPDALTGQKKEM